MRAAERVQGAAATGRPPAPRGQRGRPRARSPPGPPVPDGPDPPEPRHARRPSGDEAAPPDGGVEEEPPRIAASTRAHPEGDHGQRGHEPGGGTSRRKLGGYDALGLAL